MELVILKRENNLSNKVLHPKRINNLSIFEENFFKNIEKAILPINLKLCLEKIHSNH